MKKVLEKVAQYRGTIITDSINIERLVEAIIVNYFISKEKQSEFLMKVLMDEYFSFGLKINILEKLAPPVYPAFFEELRRVNNIRNIFAHCSPGSLDGALLFYNKKKGTYEARKVEVLHKEFVEKASRVEEQLRKLLGNLTK